MMSSAEGAGELVAKTPHQTLPSLLRVTLMEALCTEGVPADVVRTGAPTDGDQDGEHTLRGADGLLQLLDGLRHGGTVLGLAVAVDIVGGVGLKTSDLDGVRDGGGDVLLELGLLQLGVGGGRRGIGQCRAVHSTGGRESDGGSDASGLGGDGEGEGDGGRS